jgi:hypothetical protein
MKHILMTREQYAALTEPPTPTEWYQFQHWQEPLVVATVLIENRRKRFECELEDEQ